MSKAPYVRAARYVGIGALILVVFLFLAGTYFSSVPVEKEEHIALTQLGFSLVGLGDFSVQQSFGSSARDDKELYVSAYKGDDVLRVRVLSNQTDATARRYITGQSILLEAQYDSRLPPYPEFLTNQTGCAEKFLPRHEKTAEGEYFLVHADQRFNYGLCAEDLVRYKAAFGIFYCPQTQKLFQVEYFIDPSRSFEYVGDIMNSFSCKN